MATKKPTGKNVSIDALLATCAPEQRAALEKLRRRIQAAAPAATESVSYGLPAFRLNGRPLVAFGAASKHCALYPMSPAVVAAHAKELAGLDVSKGAIRFAPEKPLAAALVKKLVQARIAELEGSAAKKPAGKKPPAKAPATKKAAPKKATVKTADQAEAEVEALLRDLEHPFKEEILAVRAIILGVDPAIREGVKWKAPSFRTRDYFATIHLRARDGAAVILHRGAMANDGEVAIRLSDPEGLVNWLATDRCLVTIGAGKQVAARRAALESIIREWLRQAWSAESP